MRMMLMMLRAAAAAAAAALTIITIISIAIAIIFLSIADIRAEARRSYPSATPPSDMSAVLRLTPLLEAVRQAAEELSRQEAMLRAAMLRCGLTGKEERLAKQGVETLSHSKTQLEEVEAKLNEELLGGMALLQAKEEPEPGPEPGSQQQEELETEEATGALQEEQGEELETEDATWATTPTRATVPRQPPYPPPANLLASASEAP